MATKKCPICGHTTYFYNIAWGRCSVCGFEGPPSFHDDASKKGSFCRRCGRYQVFDGKCRSCGTTYAVPGKD